MNVLRYEPDASWRRLAFSRNGRHNALSPRCGGLIGVEQVGFCGRSGKGLANVSRVGRDDVRQPFSIDERWAAWKRSFMPKYLLAVHDFSELESKWRAGDSNPYCLLRLTDLKSDVVPTPLAPPSRNKPPTRRLVLFPQATTFFRELRCQRASPGRNQFPLEVQDRSYSTTNSERLCGARSESRTS